MSLGEQLAAAKREVGMRQRVYPRWVQAKRMTRSKADHEIAAMVAICETLEGLIEKERLV